MVGFRIFLGALCILGALLVRLALAQWGSGSQCEDGGAYTSDYCSNATAMENGWRIVAVIAGTCSIIAVVSIWFASRPRAGETVSTRRAFVLPFVAFFVALVLASAASAQHDHVAYNRGATTSEWQTYWVLSFVGAVVLVTASCVSYRAARRA